MDVIFYDEINRSKIFLHKFMQIQKEIEDFLVYVAKSLGRSLFEVNFLKGINTGRSFLAFIFSRKQTVYESIL